MEVSLEVEGRLGLFVLVQIVRTEQGCDGWVALRKVHDHRYHLDSPYGVTYSMSRKLPLHKTGMQSLSSTPYYGCSRSFCAGFQTYLEVQSSSRQAKTVIMYHSEAPQVEMARL